MIRGRLRHPDDAPDVGELSEQIVSIGGVTVEQILSGLLSGPVSYDQDHDEWVVVLTGSARLEVDGEALVLQSGDWVLIPARIPHRLIETRLGTNWLAIHAHSSAGTRSDPPSV